MKLKLVTRILFVFLSAGLIVIGCKKDQCGCEKGQIVFDLYQFEGNIYYQEEGYTAYFVPKNIYGNFTICDPADHWDIITQFDSGEDVLITGDAADDCMQRANPTYYSGYYVLHLDTLELDQFKK